MSSTHFFGAVLQGTPRTPVGGERLDKHGALSDGPSAVLSGPSKPFYGPTLLYPRNALLRRVARERATMVCEGGALHACSRAIDQPGRAGKDVKEKGAEAGEASGIEKCSQKGKWCTKLMSPSMRKCALTYRLVYTSNNAV
ncbi:hypothetical protein ALC57_07415 [Trachymyrmex cornetzi]|uniref:Uncharacterized protein n=1 Tax=Trachymyrmex cornetzi TaxID=471704 RepID=A0A195E4K5_9HYME|nr:hypothetical protein ALC57_07415 [Trachymyrmex cornetzi]